MASDHRRSICLIGIKRVGISDLLRHYTKSTIISSESDSRFFVNIDLNDLVEHSILAFWRLFLKRLTDNVISSQRITQPLKQTITKQFEIAIQLGDLFMTVEGVRTCLKAIAQAEIVTNILIVNFDRPIEIYDIQFVNNLESLATSAAYNLTLTLTADRPLYELSPNVFYKSQLSNWLLDVYIKPIEYSDSLAVISQFTNQYRIKLSKAQILQLISLCGGHVQYLQFALFALLYNTKADLLSTLLADENINLQSEEIFSSLTQTEKQIVNKIAAGLDAKPNEYLNNTGLITGKGGIFSSLFAHFLINKEVSSSEEEHLTKKELLLFELLHSNLDLLCDRELIVSKVWPEYTLYGVTDWAIDRLTSRLRQKLKRTKPHLKIQTVKTRGFKMIQT